jgi:hypothetical protein
VTSDRTIKVEALLALIERLSQYAKQARRSKRPRTFVADLRLAIQYHRRFASMLIADEAKAETDQARKHELEVEASSLVPEGNEHSEHVEHEQHNDDKP